MAAFDIPATVDRGTESSSNRRTISRWRVNRSTRWLRFTTMTRTVRHNTARTSKNRQMNARCRGLLVSEL